MTQDGVAPAAAGEAVTTVTDRRALFAVPGLVLAGGALLCATITLFILLGLTPIAPNGSLLPQIQLSVPLTIPAPTRYTIESTGQLTG